MIICKFSYLGCSEYMPAIVFTYIQAYTSTHVHTDKDMHFKNVAKLGVTRQNITKFVAKNKS